MTSTNNGNRTSESTATTSTTDAHHTPMEYSYVRAKPDSLNTEFIYYSSTIKTLAPALSRQTDRERVLPWLKKLFGPEYHAERFREKRNRYLLHLSLTLMNDGLFGIFRKAPPCGALPDIKELLEDYKPQPKEWELDKTWEEIRSDIADIPTLGPLTCMMHKQVPCPKLNAEGDKLLDNMFRYLLYLLRPCAALFNCPVNKTKLTAWMQHLCRVGPDACSYMKGVRNDYIIALYSYACDLRLAGMFQTYPAPRMLISLPRASRQFAERHPLMGPASPEASSFLQDQPPPRTGAFCYLAITGQPVHAPPTAEPPQIHKVGESEGPIRVSVNRTCE